MHVPHEKLHASLQRGLAPVYLVFGDEPLQHGECVDAIRAAARQRGFDERIVLEADNQFDWATLRQYQESLSLFAERRLIEIRLPTGKPGREGAEALKTYAARPADDTVLVVGAGKLDGNDQRTAWFKALDGTGVTVQIWPVRGRDLPGWIQMRARALGLGLDVDAGQLLAERCEGNLLAAVQELQKLLLAHGEGKLSLEQVVSATADSSRFDVFDLANSALAGDAPRALRILRGLAREGVREQIVAWALTREVQSVAAVSAARAHGLSLDRAMEENKVWRARQAGVRSAVRRLPPDRCLHLLHEAARVNRMVKGAPGEPWIALEHLTLGLCGVTLFPRAPNIVSTEGTG